jgi:hypothetical protein
MKPTFSISLSRPEFEAARYRLVTQHLLTADTDADHGRLQARGVVVDYAFSGANSQLAITIEQKPALLTAAHIEAKIREWFSQA